MAQFPVSSAAPSVFNSEGSYAGINGSFLRRSPYTVARAALLCLTRLTNKKGFEVGCHLSKYKFYKQGLASGDGHVQFVSSATLKNSLCRNGVGVETVYYKKLKSKWKQSPRPPQRVWQSDFSKFSAMDVMSRNSKMSQHAYVVADDPSAMSLHPFV